MAKDQSNPPAPLITLEIARAAGQAHGETAFTAMVSLTAMVSPEIS